QTDSFGELIGRKGGTDWVLAFSWVSHDYPLVDGICCIQLVKGTEAGRAWARCDIWVSHNHREL
ncbi:hypothetical protein C3F00_045630, partial [Pseudomonas sp. MWU13-2860]